METKNSIMKKIEREKQAIKKFGVKKLFLVGSYATGHARKDSDVDFVVHFNHGRGSFLDFVHLKRFLEETLGKNVDMGEDQYIREEIRQHMFGGTEVEARI